MAKTTLEKIQAIIADTIKYTPGGASTYQGNGWSHTSARKPIRYGYERRNVEDIIKNNPELKFTFGHGGHHFGLQYIDTENDICYYIAIEKAQYVGRPDYIQVDTTYNWTVSQTA